MDYKDNMIQRIAEMYDQLDDTRKADFLEKIQSLMQLEHEYIRHVTKLVEEAKKISGSE